MIVIKPNSKELSEIMPGDGGGTSKPGNQNGSRTRKHRISKQGTGVIPGIL